MEESAIISPHTPSRWSIIPPVAAGALTLWIFYIAAFIFPVLAEWQVTGMLAIIPIGAAGGWIARRRQLLTVGLLAGLFMTEITWLLARDGYILLRYARPRHIAFNDTDPSWFFFSPAERATGLTYVALQRKGTEGKLMFAKALDAASQVAVDGHIVLATIAQGQVKAGFFEDAEATVRCIQNRLHFDLYFTIIAAEMAKHGAQTHAQRLFAEAIQKAKQHPEQYKRDRDLYLIAYRQWEGGMHNESRRTAELIQTADSKADLLDRLNDVSQLEIARQQAGAGRFTEAEATIKQHVKDPYRYCDGLIRIGTAAATNAHSADARRIFDHALKSAQEIESPIGGNSVMAEIALRQLELGFQAESQKTLTLITHAGVKAELVKKLARLKPASARL